MRTENFLILSLVLNVSFTVVVCGRVCKQSTDSCSCIYDDTKVEISLRNIDNPNGIRYTKQIIYEEDGTDTGYWLDYNPCTPFNLETCTDVLGCQQLKKDPTKTFPSGLPTKFSTSFKDNNLIFKYQGKDFDNFERNMEVHLICDQKAVEPVMGKVTTIKHEELSYETYIFNLTTSCACESGCNPSKGSSKLSTGSLLCILFFVFFAVYFIGGFIFLKFYKHHEGTEAIPNYEFWKDLPAKIKDGFVFTKDQIRGKGNEYEAI